MSIFDSQEFPVGNVEQGFRKVSTAELEMVGLRNIVSLFKSSLPLRDLSVLGCVTVTAQTAVYILALLDLGADVSWCSDNRFATDADVICYLQARGILAFAEPNMSISRYFQCMDLAIEHLSERPALHIHDDGCDITRHILDHHRGLLAKVHGLIEQTTCGTNALRRLFAANLVSFPAIDINAGFLKRFDNHKGTQQSLVCSLTNAGVSVAGRRVGILGYGSVGQGAASVLRALGAAVSVVEADILKLAQAAWDGFDAVSIEEALGHCGVLLTASGCAPAITGDLIGRYAIDGIIFGNLGHGQQEYDVEWLDQFPSKVVNNYRKSYRLPDGREIHSLCDGALINFVAAAANPSAALSFTFTLCTLAHLELLSTRSNAHRGIRRLSDDMERYCAELHFPDLQQKVYRLNSAQREYLGLEPLDYPQWRLNGSHPLPR